MEFRKIVMIILYARQQKRHRCIDSLMDSVGQGEDGMIWENVSKHIISYVKWITSPGLMHDTGCSGLVHGFNSCRTPAYLSLGMWNLPAPGIKPCPLHWEVDSYALGHQGSHNLWILVEQNSVHSPEITLNITIVEQTDIMYLLMLCKK